MIIRKCNDNEIGKIIAVADESFAPDREQGFSFKISMPKIYDNKNKDYSNIHFVAENERAEFVGVAGNLIETIDINENQYKFSRVGTVGTIPKERGKGIMKSLMKAVDEENANQKVVFSVLCGKRDRYRNYGYERAGLSCYYTFDKEQAKYLANPYSLSIALFKKKSLDELYDIYLKKEKFILRDKNAYELTLKAKKFKLYVIRREKDIVGYFVLKGSTIVELNLIDEKYIEGTLKCILSSNKIEFNTNRYNSKTIQIVVNNLRQDLTRWLDKFSEYKSLNDELSIKVYDFAKFMEMIFQLNIPIKQNVKEVYQIGDKAYEFKAKAGKIQMKLTKKKCKNHFKNQEKFLRFALGNDLLFERISLIFPVMFDLNVLDNF